MLNSINTSLFRFHYNVMEFGFDYTLFIYLFIFMISPYPGQYKEGKQTQESQFHNARQQSDHRSSMTGKNRRTGKGNTEPLHKHNRGSKKGGGTHRPNQKADSIVRKHMKMRKK